MCLHVQSKGVSGTAACPPSPVAYDPSALRLPPPLPPPASNSSPCRPAVVLYYCAFQGNCIVGLEMPNFFFNVLFV